MSEHPFKVGDRVQHCPADMTYTLGVGTVTAILSTPRLTVKHWAEVKFDDWQNDKILDAVANLKAAE